MLDWI
jgi:hypothetical protein